MQIQSTYNQLTNKPSLLQILKSANNKNALELNCVKIGIIQEFYPEDLTVKVLIASKKLIGLNPDGSQILKDYPPIFAKVCYCNPFETFPLKQGDECVLLFCDREIESWFINSDVNQQKYTRMHDLTDAVAIVGIRSLPKMINILKDCFHLFYGNSDIQLKEDEIDLNSSTLNLNAANININGKLIINGQEYLLHKHTNGNNGSATGGVIQ